MIKKIIGLGLFGIFLFFLTGIAAASPILDNATLETPGTTRVLHLPPAAEESSVISLGSAIDPGTGKKVDGIAIIHRKNAVKAPTKPKPGTNACYGYIAAGAKWKTVESWVVNATNIDGLDGATVSAFLRNGIAKWEDATDGNVANGLGVDILGQGITTTSALLADTTSPDNKNEVYFADITDSNAIAVTIVWGIFSGPTSRRELVEWDQIYDDITYDWSTEAIGVAGKMDFDNIATHELGHSMGMADLYNSCTNETMYGYADNAETKKRDLNTGDITGINNLY